MKTTDESNSMKSQRRELLPSNRWNCWNLLKSNPLYLYSFIDEQGINYEELETTHVQNKSIVYKSTKGSREKINLYRMMRMRMLMKTYLFQRKTW